MCQFLPQELPPFIYYLPQIYYYASLLCMEEKTIGKGDESTIYEVSYLLLLSLAQEELSLKAESLKQTLTRLGGAVISDENPVLVNLAYPITKIVQTIRHKVTMGYFGWIKFEISGEALLAVKKALDADDLILRYLIIKTVRENTLLNGKMTLKKEEKMKREDEEIVDEIPEVVKETAPEELDKSIDDLVIV